MTLAKIVFWIAGIWGVLVLVPLYFAADLIGQRDPPSLTHVEYYFGFLTVALAWQFAFMVIATDPIRFRPLMIPAMLEKFGNVATLAVLRLQGRMRFGQFMFNTPDLVLGVMFVFAYVATRKSTR